MSVRPIPQGYHTVTPYLIIKGAAAAIDFYVKAFNAVETMRMADPGGSIGHAEIRIGDSTIMMAEEHPDMGVVGPKTLGGAAVHMLVYVDDVDTVFARAIEAGAVEKRPLANQFYGDRTGTLTDPFGHQWTIATHVEDVSAEELDRRFQAILKGEPG